MKGGKAPGKGKWGGSNGERVVEEAKVGASLAGSGQGQHLLSFTFSFPFSGLPIHLFVTFSSPFFHKKGEKKVKKR